MARRRGPGVSWREHSPEPSRHWIRFSPKRWPASPAPYLDLVERRIEWPGGEPDEPLPERPKRGRDLLYAPPVAPDRRAERERWVLDVERSGGAVLVEIGSDEVEEPTVTGSRVLDLLGALLAGAPEAVEPAPPEIAAVMPLVPGLSGDPGAWEPWLAALARRSPGRTVVGVEVELTPVDRRRLSELGGERNWEALFHAEAATEREFARVAAARGLSPFPRRPELELFPRRRRNRDLATLLRECGDLWLRLGRPEPTGQGLLAAARHVEATPLDLAGLAREGNLEVLGWLSETAREVIAASVAEKGGALLEELRAEYLAADGDVNGGGE